MLGQAEDFLVFSFNRIKGFPMLHQVEGFPMLGRVEGFLALSLNRTKGFSVFIIIEPLSIIELGRRLFGL